MAAVSHDLGDVVYGMVCFLYRPNGDRSCRDLDDRQQNILSVSGAKSTRIGRPDQGVFYSNDRSYIVFHSPPEKVGLGMGVVITGLSVGLTVATIGTPLLIKTWNR
ncbi:hypothetical protein [Effusibacillus dendaii]|uniref:Uncharacterized protein n=1 Tax=Effusibacillus dendaii TaxID=2743772 RepID=A0A7I8DK17_9BACL|nr:hypothetical protein [Effusibacillus dendaii]BCJ88231.1 hypothetical protein skT53_32160 [Effusibacillus dendaii]